MEKKILTNNIMAILFASGEAFDEDKLIKALSDEEKGEIVSKEDIADAVAKLNILLKSFPIEVLRIENSYKLSTKKEFASVIKNALEIKHNTPLSQAAMEVLSIIAYNQPVTKAFVEQIRGVDCSGVINSLCKKELIEESKRLELPGRPIAYKTTKNFLYCFGLESLEGLPEIPHEVEGQQSL